MNQTQLPLTKKVWPRVFGTESVIVMKAPSSLMTILYKWVGPLDWVIYMATIYLSLKNEYFRTTQN